MQVELFKCAGCGISKPRTAEYFYRSKRYKDGFRASCKECSRRQTVKYNGKILDIDAYNLERYGPAEGAARNDAWNLNRTRIQKQLGIFTD